MKIVNYIYTGCTIVFAAALCLFPASAQQTSTAKGTTPAGRERMKMERLWFNNTLNAAGSQLDKVPYYSEFGLGYSYDSGDFTRPQVGTSSRDITFSTEGGGDVGGFYAWGSFDYDNNLTRGVLYNMSVLDPLRGNPYILADYRASDWYKQLFDLRMNLSTPLYFGGKAAFGIDVAYTANTGAKQIDPRPKVDYYRIAVRPGVAYAVDGRNTVGLNLEYTNMREEANITNNNITETRLAAVMRGFGFFSELNFTRDEIFSQANSIGGALQYSYTGTWKGIITVGVLRDIEKVSQNTTRPLSLGNLDALRWHASASAILRGRGSDIHLLNGAFTRTSRNGIEDVTAHKQTTNGAIENVVVDSNVRSNYKVSEATVSYDYIHSDNPTDYIWRVGAHVGYLNNSDIYYLPESVRDLSNLEAGLSGSYNFLRKSSWRLLASARVAYNANLDRRMELAVPTPEHTIITGLMQPDFAYLTCNYVDCGVSLAASTGLGSNNTGSIYVSVGYDLLKPIKTHSSAFTPSDSRGCLRINVGCMF